jgi:hypothetical protein
VRLQALKMGANIVSYAFSQPWNKLMDIIIL